MAPRRPAEVPGTKPEGDLPAGHRWARSAPRERDHWYVGAGDPAVTVAVSVPPIVTVPAMEPAGAMSE